MRNFNTTKIKELLQYRETVLLGVILCMSIIMAIASPVFLNGQNLESIILGLSVEGTITIGMVILLVSGGLDLSIGSTLALTGIITGLSMGAGIPVVISVIFGLLSAISIGFINGILIAKVQINPFIATLGVNITVRGLVLILAGGTSIPNLPEAYNQIGQGKLFGLQYPIYVLVFLVFVADYMLRNVRFLRQSYYIGDNEKTAFLNGINVSFVKMFNYCLTALMAGISGIMITARLGNAPVTIGQGMEMKVLTAAIIGGASLKGGEGTILGAFLGAVLMGILSNSLNLLGVNIYWQNFATGLILILAILTDKIGKKRLKFND